MKIGNYICSMFIIIFAFANLATAAALSQGNRFELSGFLSMVSYGKNISSQVDIGGGVNIMDFLNISITVDGGYRNYSIVTNDYISLSLGKAINKNELRIGANAGFYTLWFTGYNVSIPSYGAECIYSYYLTPNFCLRLKERVSVFVDNSNCLYSSSTLLGFCFSFINRPSGKKP